MPVALAALIPLILQGLTILPSILNAFATIFKKSGATAAEKANAINSAAGTVLGAAVAVSTGGQKETLEKAQTALPLINSITENLMQLAESSGKPGEMKQAYVTNVLTATLQGFEQLTTGEAHTTVDTIKPAAEMAINTLVPLMFPKKDETAIENIQPAA